MTSRALVIVALVTVVACSGVPSGQTTTPTTMAPDFTLALGDGGSYTLSDGANPVYLVFWAEW